MSLATFRLPSGAEIEVQSSSVPARMGVGVDQASAFDRVGAVDWSGAMAKVAEVAEQAVAALGSVTAGCKERSVEFGVSVGGKTGIVLVEGTVSANLKVVLKW